MLHVWIFTNSERKGHFHYLLLHVLVFMRTQISFVFYAIFYIIRLFYGSVASSTRDLHSRHESESPMYQTRGLNLSCHGRRLSCVLVIMCLPLSISRECNAILKSDKTRIKFYKADVYVFKNLSLNLNLSPFFLPFPNEVK